MNLDENFKHFVEHKKRKKIMFKKKLGVSLENLKVTVVQNHFTHNYAWFLFHGFEIYE